MPTSSRLLIALFLTLLTLAPASRADDALAPIEASAVIDAPIAEVWHAWTTSEGLESFLVEKANIELRPGGPYEIFFSMQAPEGARGSENCSVLSFLPNQMLSFQWNAPPKFEHARFIHTWVVVNFEELSPSRTRVDLTHLGFAENAADNPDHADEWKQVRAYFTNAWPSVLSALKQHFAAESDSPTPNADRAIKVASRLVGGEWVHEGTQPSGATFRVRNVIRAMGPGRAFLADGWLGSDAGMYYHASTHIWVDHESDTLRFQSINQDGNLMVGTIEPIDENTIIEHIQILAEGKEPGFIDARIRFVSDSEYHMTFERDGNAISPPLAIKRVDKAPEALRTLTDGTVVD
ncbi:MAG: SRPBCC domain-containing protein [Phycisphaerales bacterium]|nr:SRPBCC domain-containing protein [Phycisphaerales bacterium]